jgi:DivIVA domain-containing protein
VPLTPEEIEARRFRLAQNGYDCESVDRFLAEIAEAVRAPTDSVAGADEFGRLGQEIAAILRNARDSAGAVRAEAEGHAAALRSRAELQADDVRKAAEADAESLRTLATREADDVRALATREADDVRAQVQAEADTLRAAAQTDADQIRLEAERRLQQAEQARAQADEQLATSRAAAESEAAALLERTEHEARRLADAITTEATQRAELIRESEQSTYLRLLAARDDLQQAIDRLVTNLGVDARMTNERETADEGESVVDLTTAPAQVRHETVPAGAWVTNGDDAAHIAPVGLDAPVGATAGDPLLRMVRAAVGRAAGGSAGDGPDQQASAS